MKQGMADLIGQLNTLTHNVKLMETRLRLSEDASRTIELYGRRLSTLERNSHKHRKEQHVPRKGGRGGGKPIAPTMQVENDADISAES